MRLEVITTYYKETFLAPLFFLHYAWADLITTITARFPDDKMDDVVKMDLINEAIARSTADWVIVVDFDEFVFPRPLGSDPRKALEAETGDIIDCHMLRVWRHRTDSNIDRMKPPMLQRRHGQADHHKPSLFRPKGVTIGIGNHSANYPAHYKWGTVWSAAHWANADPAFGIHRSKVDRQMRLSSRRLGEIPQWLEPGFLQQEYLNHDNDPIVL